MADHDTSSLTGLSDKQAQEFHSIFMMSFIMFVVIAIIAHVLVWQWRPWFPSVEGYTSAVQGLEATAQTLLTRFG